MTTLALVLIGGIAAFVAVRRRASMPAQSARRSPARFLSRFPTSMILVGTYGPYVVLPGISNGTIGPSIGIVALGLFSVLAVEVLLFPLSARAPKEAPFSIGALSTITWIGVAATVLSARGGARSYRAQIYGEGRTLLSSITTPLVPWVVIGLAFALLAYKAGQASKRDVTRLFVGSLGVCFTTALYSGILGSASLVMFPLAILAVLLHLIRFRMIFVGLVLATLIWPTVHQYRNQIRLNAGVTEAQLGGSAYERFNVDRQLALLDQYGKRDINAPSLPDVFRYGLVPSILDRGRPPVLIGQSINSAYGGSGRSATSLTLFANVYLAADWQGVALFGTLMALGLRMLLRGPPIAIVIAVLLIETMLSIDSTYPVSVAAFLQQLVALLVALGALQMFGGRSRGRVSLTASI